MTAHRLAKPLIGIAALLILVVGSQADDVPLADISVKELQQNLRIIKQGLAAFSTESSFQLPDDSSKVDSDAFQQALDQHVAFVVTINPESRVKVQRGPAVLRVERGWPSPVLVKVINEGGITASLQVKKTGPEAVKCRFMEFPSFSNESTGLSTKLSGRVAEYQVLIISNPEPGNTEVTLSFDVGQSTQDLGFRAEIPCLLSPRPASRPFYFDKAKLLEAVDPNGSLVGCGTVQQWEAMRRAHILSNIKLVMGSCPAVHDSAVEVRIEDEKEYHGLTLRKIAYRVDETDWVSAIVLIPRLERGRGPAVLCLHQTTSIGKGEPSGMGGKANLQYALEMAQRGYVTLSPDYPGFGDYQKCNPYEMGYVSATMKGIVNHRAAVTVLSYMPQVDPQRIGCMGHSLGGHNTLFVGLFDDRLKALASSCGFCSFPKYYGGQLKGWSHKGYMPRIASVYQCDPSQMPFDFTEILGALAPRAVFINAPVKDDNFSVDGVQDCVKAARPVFELYGKSKNLVVEYPSAGHDFPAETRTRCYEFFDQHLKMK